MVSRRRVTIACSILLAAVLIASLIAQAWAISVISGLMLAYGVLHLQGRAHVS